MVLMILNLKNGNLLCISEFMYFLYSITYNSTFTVRETARQHKPCKNSNYLYLEWIILRKIRIFLCHKTKKLCTKSSCARKHCHWSVLIADTACLLWFVKINFSFYRLSNTEVLVFFPGSWATIGLPSHQWRPKLTVSWQGYISDAYTGSP